MGTLSFREKIEAKATEYLNRIQNDRTLTIIEKGNIIRSITNFVEDAETLHKEAVAKLIEIVDKMYEMAFGDTFHLEQEREQELADGIVQLKELLRELQK